MKKPRTRNVTCKVCGFSFEIENKPQYGWMDSYEKCLIGQPAYCKAKPIRQSGDANQTKDGAPKKRKGRKTPTP